MCRKRVERNRERDMYSNIKTYKIDWHRQTKPRAKLRLNARDACKRKHPFGEKEKACWNDGAVENTPNNRENNIARWCDVRKIVTVHEEEEKSQQKHTEQEKIGEKQTKIAMESASNALFGRIVSFSGSIYNTHTRIRIQSDFIWVCMSWSLVSSRYLLAHKHKAHCSVLYPNCTAVNFARKNNDEKKASRVSIEKF